MYISVHRKTSHFALFGIDTTGVCCELSVPLTLTIAEIIDTVASHLGEVFDFDLHVQYRTYDTTPNVLMFDIPSKSVLDRVTRMLNSLGVRGIEIADSGSDL